jgi:hypothetical protein
MKVQRFPPGWDAERVQRVIDHYDNLTDDEMVAEDEAAAAGEGEIVMIAVPKALVEKVRALIAREQGA